MYALLHSLLCCVRPLSIGRIRRKRPSLRIIVSSATIDAEAFLNFFLDQPFADGDANSGNGASGSADKDENQAEATILSLEGRTFPVEIAYTAQPVEDYVKASVQAVWELHLNVSAR